MALVSEEPTAVYGRAANDETTAVRGPARAAPESAADPARSGVGDDPATRPISPATGDVPVPESQIGPARPDAASPADAASSATPQATPAKPPRFYALDAFRGLTIALMVFVNWPGNWYLPGAFGHSEWSGLTLADTVFPGFLVAMGTAMPYATRTSWRNALGRTFKLFMLGCVLVSYKYMVPMDIYPAGILQMTAIAYLLVWLVTRTPRYVQWSIMAVFFLGITAAWLWYSPAGVPAGSFTQDANLADWFDTTVLGIGANPENPHGWIQAASSVYIGYLAGEISRATSGLRRIGWLATLGAGTLILGVVLAVVIPLNKYLWTPSFVLVTGGIAVLELVLLALIIPASSKGGLLRPLVVLGGHAIVVYAFSETIVGRAHNVWLWPYWEPLVTERFGELFAGALFPAIAVLVCFVLAYVMEKLDIHVRL